MILIILLTSLLFQDQIHAQTQRPAVKLVGGLSKVELVVVFADRAQVTRRQTVKLERGTHSIQYLGLTSILDRESLKVQTVGGSNSNVDILGIRTAEKHSLKSQNAELEAAKLQLQSLNQSEKTIKQKISELLRVHTNLDSLQNHYANSLSLKIHQGKWSQEELRQFVKLLESQDDSMVRAWQKCYHDFLALHEKIEMTSARIDALQGPSDEKRLDVYVDVIAKASTDVTLDVSYLVMEVGWRPTYDLRLLASGEESLFQQYAMVHQRTGESWSDARIHLSNQRSELRPQIPTLSVAYVEGRKVDKVKTVINSAQKKEDALGVGEVIDENSEGDKSLNVVFKLPGRQKINSGTDETKVFVGERKVRPHESLEVVPKQMTYVYKRAKLKNPFSWTLPEGTLSIYRDKSLVGQTLLPQTPLGDEISLNIGIQHELVVKYSLADETSQEGLISSNKSYTRTLFTDLMNYSLNERKLRVWEQVAISEIKSLEVALIEGTTKGYVKDEKKPGWIYWDLTVPSRKNLQVQTRISVTTPKDFQFSW
ncbi:MAG: mucoidy inhibitor MuiA family protein [Bdellovibrionaceae bacterium]|nr:mucoidy inhibitor MuiA family protein [Pseudobdellovibrionaceae bacterium]